ncbi:unnamed protein product [Brachionus calyciflorus]|uniref:Uncharacterized protein n=1 Tax=Brachionus calyciflorus TaxID=104777 RepID=A0A813YJW0_9BILA|nr:unnamed protein product [Brachionus calyciflorus]
MDNKNNKIEDPKINQDNKKGEELKMNPENPSISEDLKSKIESQRNKSWQQILKMTFPGVRKKAYRNDAAIRIYISFLKRSNKTARSEKPTEERNKK